MCAASVSQSNCSGIADGIYNFIMILFYLMHNDHNLRSLLNLLFFYDFLLLIYVFLKTVRGHSMSTHTAPKIKVLMGCVAS